MTSRSNELRALIEMATYQEKACQAFLVDVALHLLPFRMQREDIIETGREERSRVGDSDFSVSVEVDNGAFGRRIAYVWEVKAPQCYLFTQDSAANRMQPTKELYSAENQLLNYVAELAQSDNFKAKFGLDGVADVVKPGGIIIGRKDTILEDESNPSRVRLARAAYAIRDGFLWSGAGIRVLTWDWVCDQLARDEMKPPTNAVRSKPAGQPATPATARSLLSFAHQTLDMSDDDDARRSAIDMAYTAVETKVRSAGTLVSGGIQRNMRETIAATLGTYPKGQVLSILFRRLSAIHIQAKYQFDQVMRSEDVEYALRAAQQIIDKMPTT
jgi:hypothetical protein